MLQNQRISTESESQLKITPKSDQNGPNTATESAKKGAMWVKTSLMDRKSVQNE